mmetsp:Transcript_4139/g.11197  ORF Transcript_4139/g.11197 Transcript_4139/m.11197 type:complete len:243 (+) Transcript_4139:324-1052(+)
MPHGPHAVLQAVRVPRDDGQRPPGVPRPVVSRDRGDQVRAVPHHVSPVLHRRGEAEEAREGTGAGRVAGCIRATRRADGQLPDRLRQAAHKRDGLRSHQPQLHARGRGCHATARASERRRRGYAVQREHARRGHRLHGQAAGGEHGRAARRERGKTGTPPRARRRRGCRPGPSHREPAAQLLGADRGVDAVRVPRAVHHRGDRRGFIRRRPRFVSGFYLPAFGVHAAAVADRAGGVRVQAAS